MTTQTVLIDTYNYGAALSSATLRDVTTDVLVATADTVNEVTTDGGLYAAVFGEASVIAAGTYRLRAVISGQPIVRYATLAGTDAEVVISRSERLAELDPAARVKLDASQPDYEPATAAALATNYALLQLTDTDVAAMEARLPSDPADQSAVEAAITAATSPLATSSALSTAAGNITTILGKFTGITLLARWLGILGGKTADSTTLTEFNATTGGTSYDNTTDSPEAIRDRGDAAWITGGSGSESMVMVSTTIATLTSQTVFTLTAGSADNDVYNDQLVVITDAATSTQKARMLVSDYVGSTKTLTLASAPGFTIAAGDSIAIIAVAGLTAGQRNQLALIGAGTRMTVAADLGTEITLKIGDTYAASRSTAKRIDVNDSDSSIYDILTGAEVASIAFGFSNAKTIDVVTGTVDPETITHTAASGSVSAYTTVYVEVAVSAALSPVCGDYDIQITFDDDTRHTPFGGKCELVRDFKS